MSDKQTPESVKKILENFTEEMFKSRMTIALITAGNGTAENNPIDRILDMEL